LHALEERVGRQARLAEGRADHARVVHLLRVGPHVAIYLVDVVPEAIEALSGDRAAHDLQRVHREVRIALEARDRVLLEEALHLDRLVGALVLDPGEGHRG